jgi:hypothetical protein
VIFIPLYEEFEDTKWVFIIRPQGKRKRGRPKNSWCRGIISELQAINTTWGEAKRKAQERTRWKMRRGFAPSSVDYKKGALDSQPQVIKFTSCLPIIGSSLRVLRLLPPLKLAMSQVTIDLIVGV